MNIKEFLKDNPVYLDGGMGTLLQARGLCTREYPERLNITHPDIIKDIHLSYFDAGSNIVATNTFGANLLKFSHEELEDIIRAAIENARAAQHESSGTQPKFVSLDIGPTGKLLKPYGDLDFEDAVAIFAETVRLGVKYGADLVYIETMNDSYETKAAVLAAKENCALPVFVSNAYGEDGKLMTGATPAAMVAMLEGMGVDAIGANCSLGPEKLLRVVDELLENASVPVLLKPNAGLPEYADGQTVYTVTPEDFAEDMEKAVSRGVRIMGGCCGTTPEHISALYSRTHTLPVTPLTKKDITVVSSYARAVRFGEEPILIGERINPTGKKRFRQALIEEDIDYILGEGIDQEQRGVHILDVNVGIPDIDETKMLPRCIYELQAVTALPLQIDTADIAAMEMALRLYNGKPLVNSVNGKQESMHAVFPVVKKYGGVVVALTLDEDGIPESAEGRVEIAKKILRVAAEYGIDKKDIIFDTLAMTVSADNRAATVTLEALSRISREMGAHTSLGISNVSFGLPERDAVNSTFFALALQNGLSAAIMNPRSAQMMQVYYSYRALKGLDKNCADYIAAAPALCVRQSTSTELCAHAGAQSYSTDLQAAIGNGLKERAAELTEKLLQTVEPLCIVQNEIIPALDAVGVGYEQKRVYLPSLLMSAEAAKAAFEVIKTHISVSDSKKVSGKRVVIATVHGDIHDIGKNIVKLLLENYGFDVLDLGKDVPAKQVLDAVLKAGAEFVGLSALMTTTVPAMEETVALIKKNAPFCKTVVGGAVLNAEYAAKMGADFYAKDAMDTVRYMQA